MILKTSQFSIQDKNIRDIDNVKNYPTLDDLMREQKVITDKMDSLEKELEENPSKHIA